MPHSELAYLVVVDYIVVSHQVVQRSLSVVQRKEECLSCHLVVVCCTVVLGLTGGQTVGFLAAHQYRVGSG